MTHPRLARRVCRVVCAYGAAEVGVASLVVLAAGVAIVALEVDLVVGVLSVVVGVVLAGVGWEALGWAVLWAGVVAEVLELVDAEAAG
jgi:hypothetical protein